MGDTKRVQRDKPAEHGTGKNAPRYSTARLHYELAKVREVERLRFEGELDKWMKRLGTGISGYQPEAYVMIDHALAELVRLREGAPKLGVTLDGTPIHPGNFPKPSGPLITEAVPVAYIEPSIFETLLAGGSGMFPMSNNEYRGPNLTVPLYAEPPTAALEEEIKKLKHDLASAEGRAKNATSNSEYWRNVALEEAANAAETAQVPGSLLRPGIAKIIRALKSKEAK